MKVNILKDEKDYMEVEIKGEDHTLGNMVRKELWKVSGTKEASYVIKHPLVSSMIFSVRSSSKPKKVFHAANSQIKSKIKEMKALVKKL